MTDLDENVLIIQKSTIKGNDGHLYIDQERKKYWKKVLKSRLWDLLNGGENYENEMHINDPYNVKYLYQSY